MHIEAAAESFTRMTKPKHSEPLSDQQVVEVHVAEKAFLALAESIGDEKISSIVATIRKNAGNRYAKVTQNQRYALAAALLAMHTSAFAVYAAAVGVSADEFAAALAEV